MKSRLCQDQHSLSCCHAERHLMGGGARTPYPMWFSSIFLATITNVVVLLADHDCVFHYFFETLNVYFNIYHLYSSTHKIVEAVVCGCLLEVRPTNPLNFLDPLQMITGKGFPPGSRCRCRLGSRCSFSLHSSHHLETDHQKKSYEYN